MATEPDPAVETVAHYDRHAGAFAAETADLDLAPLHDRFLRRVPAGGRVLDAGCGTGRDALAFARRGYRVVAFDASEAMVGHTRARMGGEGTVLRMRFDEVAWRGEFDGVWACASLLHVPRDGFEAVGRSLADALRRGGAWYLSFKLGAGERRVGARLFVDHTEASLRAALEALPVEVVAAWTSGDVRPGRERERWLNAVAVRR